MEVDLRGGKADIVFAGLPDAAVKEARERVKAAILNSGYGFPRDTRTIVNLAPATLRKEGNSFDLPIAIAMLRSAGEVHLPAAEDFLLIGELSLDGRVRPVRGVLCVADRAGRGRRWRGLVVPVENAAEAAMAKRLPVFPVASLGEAVRLLADIGKGETWIPEPSPDWPPEDDAGAAAAPDFTEVRGQEGAVRAALLAAAGGHNLLLVGPPGSGKTMVAERLPGILPSLSRDEAIEVAKIHSVAGLLRGNVSARRPFRSPHHTVSPAALLGGGPRATPGEITLAHRGVLFLDEFPEFDRRCLEALREPLEKGEVAISRVAYRVRYPCRMLLVAAMNPCPCGNHGVAGRDCRCGPGPVQRYRARVSGPLMDRMDLQVRVPPVRPAALEAGVPPGPTSAELRRRVEEARALQGKRGRLNADLSVEDLDRWAPLDEKGREFLRKAADRLHLSARAVVRVRRLARSAADLEGVDAIRNDHLAEAISFRLGEEG